MIKLKVVSLLGRVTIMNPQKKNNTYKCSIYKATEDINLSSFESDLAKKGYEHQTTSKQSISGFQVKLHYKKSTSTPKWKGFITELSNADQKILKTRQSANEGFVLSLKKLEYVFFVTGGIGAQAVAGVIDTEFGLNVFERLVEKDQKILKSSQDKNFIGSVFGSTQHFRRNFNFNETDHFGKIHRSLTVNLNKDIIIDTFGLSDDDIKNDAICVAKSSFAIKKAISLDSVIKIIGGCTEVLKLDPKMQLNSVTKISKKKQKALVSKLEEGLFEQLWDRYNLEEDNFPFDLCHSEVEDYMTASEYLIEKYMSKNDERPKSGYFKISTDKIEGTLTNIDDLFDYIKKIEKPPKKLKNLKSLLSSLRITALDDDGTIKTQAKFMFHIMGDVTIPDGDDAGKYFFLENQWYLIDNKFIDRLNEKSQNYIQDTYHNDLEQIWDHTSEGEGEYNLKYLGQPNTLVLDKVTPENIELCDIMKWDENNVYLFHVKKGFGNMMRDLSLQASIAASKVLEDLSEKNYLGAIYDSLETLKNSSNPESQSIGLQKDAISKSNFLDLFNNRTIHVVLAVLDPSNRDLKTQIVDFKSSIAKFSLCSCYEHCRNLEPKIKVAFTQIH
jgi:uncharacterized protein (TIGR04141 family)